ncbi:hypothetical protein [Sphingomonas sp.]|uniref:hypothetical protein n=1 Tax=Sphingomonas sp. TaxID=28214 RepID=UPI001EB16DA5|nr:hypothetical protein [Sphingomonas sp.]MBX3595628.1 hypothetical protein [Sphingomonas sp.]
MSAVAQPVQAIEIDRVRNLVIVTPSGFFTPASLHHYTMETRRAIDTLGDAAGKHVTLYDFSAVIAAPPETIELLHVAFANPVYRRIRARKVAFVSPSALMTMQLQRVRTARPDITLFSARASALEWLLAP